MTTSRKAFFDLDLSDLHLIYDPFVATEAQLATASAFERAGYREVGFSGSCLVLLDRRGDEVHVNELGRVVFDPR